jgi:hypothetical protein
MATALNREDIVTGFRELIAELRATGEVAGIKLVGGAALALRYFDRGTTQDLDALHVRPGSDAAVSAAAARVAFRHDWDPAWLNFAVTKADALPALGRAVEWESIYDENGIVIEVASKESLLAMKLRANRPGRDTRDIRFLLGVVRHPLSRCGRRLLRGVLPRRRPRLTGDHDRRGDPRRGPSSTAGSAGADRDLRCSLPPSQND